MTPTSSGLAIARATLIVAAAFTAVVAGVLAVNYTWQSSLNISSSEDIAAMRDELAVSPDDAAALQERIRAYDMLLRRTHFAHELVRKVGVWLLAVGAVATVLAGHTTRTLSPPKPRGKLAPPPVRRDWPSAVALAAMAALAVGAAALVYYLAPAPRVRPPVQLAATPAVLPTPRELAANWWGFRGPGGLGVWKGDAPVDFDIATGRNVLWKVPVPLDGQSSPVVWGKRVLLTAATANKRMVYCYDSDTGAVSWSAEVNTPQGRAAAPPAVMDETGFAAPTCVVDGYRVFAVFATGEVACFNLDGSLVWTRYLGPLHTQYGHASSPTMHAGKLILQLDQGEEDEHKGVLTALDVLTGKTLWSVKRPVPSSWASPIAADTPSGPQVLTAGKPWFIAYSPDDGSEIWRAECLGGDVAPSPVYAGGLAIVANAGSSMAAVRTDSRGDVSKSLVWKAEDSLPEISSPVTFGDWVFSVSPAGTLVCRRLADGGIAWEHELEGQSRASLVAAGGRLYVLMSDGALVVCRAGDKFEQLARSELREACEATPAVSDGRLYIRSVKHLYCIGK